MASNVLVGSPHHKHCIFCGESSDLANTYEGMICHGVGNPFPPDTAGNKAHSYLQRRSVPEPEKGAPTGKWDAYMRSEGHKQYPPSPDWVEAAVTNIMGGAFAGTDRRRLCSIIRSHAPKLPSAAELARQIAEYVDQWNRLTWGAYANANQKAQLTTEIQRVLDGRK